MGCFLTWLYLRPKKQKVKVLKYKGVKIEKL